MELALRNYTLVTDFILLVFPTCHELQIILFLIFLVVYGMILLTNTALMSLIRKDLHLQIPMYFFLSNLSFIDLCYALVIVPKMLGNILSENKSISYHGCALQFYFLARAQTCQIFSLHFCKSNQIHHFFCDIPPILKLACGDTFAHEVSVYVVVMLVGTVPFMLILTSYSKIVSTILRLPTAQGWTKAFSTCSSHLLVVVLFFGSASITYFRPKSNHSAGTDKLLSLFYTIVTPMFNPLIYSLRNKDLIAALKKLFLKAQCHGSP
ncbi:Olfactory receptor-like protein OLF1 [Heterocephalus glaber]|uniref:Olfactory receptor-like protein OLF1 n=1 Tax=Heterocephalus glaber TaxID=10181 RepID=G5BR43_HETGA|nr:Olfactory receptor-like protein OLF1 [Heterocephalus glaber]